MDSFFLRMHFISFFYSTCLTVLIDCSNLTLNWFIIFINMLPNCFTISLNLLQFSYILTILCELLKVSVFIPQYLSNVLLSKSKLVLLKFDLNHIGWYANIQSVWSYISAAKVMINSLQTLKLLIIH